MNGFLTIDKPSGITSRAVVDRVKHLLRQRVTGRERLPKVGHVGTLDPLATGVLVIAIGSGTRLVELVHQQPKAYRATFRLGQRSNTDDVTGTVTAGDAQRAAHLAPHELEIVLQRFRGCIEQVPPAFSAVKVTGQRAYQMARRGEPVELRPKSVEILRLEMIRWEPPELTLDIECSSGTYIRSLARDLGECLECGALMSALTRTRVGPFELARAIPFAALTSDSLAQLQPNRVAVAHLPAYCCQDQEIARLRHGLAIAPRADGWSRVVEPRPETFALVDASGTLLGVGGWDRDRPELRPRLNLIAADTTAAADHDS